MKTGDALVYRDSQGSARYGVGVVVSVTLDEYSILWSGRGLTKYRRSILDMKLEKIFQRVDNSTALPKARHLNLGASTRGVSFNENYDRARVGLLCEKLKGSKAHNARGVANGLAAELVTKKPGVRAGGKALLLELAVLCSARTPASDDARSISRELFFGYVLQKSDFHHPEER
ncbi:MAG TPA: hypothetical protein VG778_02190 [Blastocatellia bacterium]|nr:hypothetical protein [Blastocatellia bacterium]